MIQVSIFPSIIIQIYKKIFLNYHSKIDERMNCKKRKNFAMIQVSIFPSIVIQIYARYREIKGKFQSYLDMEERFIKIYEEDIF